MKLRYLKEEANRLISKGKIDKAIETLQSAIKLDPTDAQLRLRLAECCRKVGQNNEALQALVQAGDLLKKQGHFGRAVAALKLALELAPGHPTLLQSIRHLESQKLLSGVSNSGVISGVLPGAFHGYVHSTPDLPQRGIELSPASPNEAFELETGGPVVLGTPEPIEELELSEENLIPAIEPLYPLIRRMGERALAIKASPQSRWIVVQSETPLHVKFADPASPMPASAPTSLTGEVLSDAVISKIRKSN